MQEGIVERICDNPSCPGTGGSAPSGPTVETITNGTTNRPDVAWIVGSKATRSSDNTQLIPASPLLQFCQAACATAALEAGSGS
jgi:hypothetical protein